jgi:hypothetical protein
MIKNDNKSPITAFSLFLFTGTYAKRSSGSLCMCPSGITVFGEP